MGINLMSIADKQSGYCMENGIIHTISCSIQSICLQKNQNIFICLSCLLQL